MTNDEEPVPVARVERREGVVVVFLAGELDFVAGAELSAGLSDVDVAPGEIVVFELSGTTFVDSTGLNALAAAARAIESRDGSVAVAGASVNVARVFEIVRFGDTVRLFETVEEARRAVATVASGELHAP